MSKQIYSTRKPAPPVARDNIMSQPVKVTLGRRTSRRHRQKYGPHHHQGRVTWRRSLPEDPNEDMGAQNDQGSGARPPTWRRWDNHATVLARRSSGGTQDVTAGASPMGLKRGIVARAVVEELKHMSKATKDKKEIAQSPRSPPTTQDDRRPDRGAMEKVGKTAS